MDRLAPSLELFTLRETRSAGRALIQEQIHIRVARTTAIIDEQVHESIAVPVRNRCPGVDD